MSLATDTFPTRPVKAKAPRRVNDLFPQWRHPADPYGGGTDSHYTSQQSLDWVAKEQIKAPEHVQHGWGERTSHCPHVVANEYSSLPLSSIGDFDEESLDEYSKTFAISSKPCSSYCMSMKDYTDDRTSFYNQSMASSDHLTETGSPHLWVHSSEASLITGAETLDLTETKKLPSEPSSSTTFESREILFVIIVCFAQFLSLAGLSQTFAPLIILSKSLGVSNPGIMAWPTAAYSLTLGSLTLPAGRLGDLFGHKRIFLIGWLWFAFSSIVTGFSLLGSHTMLTACRAFQGIGPALLIPNGLALFGRTFPMGMKRNMAIALFGGSGPCGVVTGAVFSSMISQLVWWPWQFWIMGIVCFFAATLAFFAVPADKVKQQRGWNFRAWEKFDLLGALTGVGGLVLVNFALNQAPIDGWTSPYISVLLGVGLVLMGVFVYVELRIAPRPLVPIKGLHRDAGLTLACIAAGWGSHGIWSYYMFLLLEDVRGLSALESCARFWPVAPIGLVAALAVGFLLKKIRVAYILSIAMLCFLLGCLFLATAPADQTYFANTFLSVIITPFGMNWSFPTAVILMSNAVPREHQGIAASLVSTMVNYSISTGLGFAGSIDRYVTPQHGVLAGYRGAWYFGIGLSGVGLFISLYFIWQSRTRK